MAQVRPELPESQKIVADLLADWKDRIATGIRSMQMTESIPATIDVER